MLQTQIVQTEDALVDQSHTSENTKFIEKERKKVSNPRWLFSTTNVYSEYMFFFISMVFFNLRLEYA